MLTASSTVPLRPYRYSFPNGLVLLVTPNPAVDVVAARFLMDAGIRREDVNGWGLSHLVASVITKGSAAYSSVDVAQIVESMGASLGTDTAPDYAVLSLKAVSEDFEPLLALAAEVMRSPTFPAQELEIERQITLQAIAARQEQPLALALRPLQEAIYGTHPYAQSSYGTLETVQNLQVDDLRSFHQRYFRPDKTVVSVAGNIDPEQAFRWVERYWGDWPPPQRAVPDPPVPLPAARQAPVEILTPQPTQQSIIAFGYLGVSVHHPDYWGLKLLLTHLCNGLSSRLFLELRERQGLAYEVSGFFPTRQDPASWVIYLGTRPSQTQVAYEQLRQEITQLVQNDLSREDLTMAQQKLIGQYTLNKQTNAQLAQLFGWYEHLGLGEEYDGAYASCIQAVDLATIQRIAATYLTIPVCSIVGPEAILDKLQTP
ncbi:M16 family metallopeptidase [Lyngbya confervoides]|uniref:Insulinase family protein n=1 Tax=Lyngbya confervoides BDU141951 TaxID=1574623 RepID=A0ABD4T919_9CYAN|nr:pitrilysin family protein [Lyngbya confervoides]MCM1985292.1 insulinase family protein [Lyngbya confervoides BDU141951]